MKTLREFYFFLLKEDEQKEIFSFDELSKYVNSYLAEQYLKKTLKYLGQGDARSVYDLGSNKVLKYASGDTGVSQNESEYNLYNSVPEEAKKVLAPVLEPHNPDFKWIVMEKVKPVSSREELEELLGIPYDLAGQFLENLCYQVKSVEEIRSHIQQVLDIHIERENRAKNNTRWGRYTFKDARIEKYRKALEFTNNFSKICLAVSELESNGQDMGRPEQLGIRNNGDLVVLDYGFNYNTSALYNPTPYQQANKAARDYQDFNDDREEKEYDKYGNEIKKPNAPSQEKKNSAKPLPLNPDDDIPFEE